MKSSNAKQLTSSCKMSSSSSSSSSSSWLIEAIFLRRNAWMTRLRSLSRHSCSDSSPSSFLYCTPNSVAVDIPATELFGSDGDGGGDGNGSSAGSKKDALGYTVAWLPYQHGQAVDILAASAVTTGEAPASSALSSSGDTSSAAAAAAAAASTPRRGASGGGYQCGNTTRCFLEGKQCEETATERSSTRSRRCYDNSRWYYRQALSSDRSVDADCPAEVGGGRYVAQRPHFLAADARAGSDRREE